MTHNWCEFLAFKLVGAAGFNNVRLVPVEAKICFQVQQDPAASLSLFVAAFMRQAVTLRDLTAD